MRFDWGEDCYMNCQEFSKRVGELEGQRLTQSVTDETLLVHAANCSGCGMRLETERALTSGLELLAAEDRKIEAPSSLRNDLLIAFDMSAKTVPGNLVLFPSRTNWARWALAAAATIILAFVLFSARWAPKTETNETARSVVPEAPSTPNEQRSNGGATDSSINESDVPVTADSEKPSARTRLARITPNKTSSAGTKSVSTQVASTEVKSEFVPLTYLNDATAMESGIVVRVEIAREQLATLGLPFDLERADEIIKADIVLGDDGVARAIRLVQ